ncbi:6,7-dimethyl-8-ribityllumazine synthase [Myxococcus sp. MISCRS1]|jgi:6,7-dimethyl-8-ribityllumazine synthase|uniref:6,7-dimethyl-8-ribityllumazine synthase n=2 Tax=Myxococcus fulvus TaxID=33 RepID=A0A511T359_MYXFU|nr:MULTISPECIES: 6,7-dimethyl-8-ribityllumazine synthase [Myxococcus]AKF82546.1 6,7-dimethyl-8-ribityllumazine synthase [Myxococcus fulvus 124B02]BDT35900.1 6,7-dimethyl-8-ribityllumazine synthase [Myxococcus sp. MH1]MBZ4407328.1 6,7-dimethyl-8-ribityllumazine synthase [Myxococcus sp. XM-1-1-1]MCK8500364.1 6,7-dimethyl-8-ribityllumazine synthase [Myxococcus fulvus]MCP3057209.1 6,7-dimethyl-8-ribityllumazine synthase [Myxococcus guangdongensis]
MPRYIEGDFLPPKGRFAICVARFNGFITEELAKGAVDTLVRHGVADADVDVYRCPGTYELPGLVRRVTESRQYVGVIALGAVIRGGTPHFDYVAGECAKGIGAVAFNAAAANPATSVTFGVLTTDTVEQAIDRAGVKAGNKGAEATLACIEMVNLYARIPALDARKG